MTKIFRLVNHLINGTIQRRFYYEKIKKQAIAREDEWNKFFLSTQESILVDLERHTKLKLYKDSNLSPNLFKGDFEFQEIQFVSTFLQRGDVFIDIGANIGYFSMIASKCVGHGSVHSFEPTEKTFLRLLESITLNKAKNVKAHQIALSNLSEERSFVTSNDGFDAYNSLGNPSQGTDFNKETLFTQPLDSLINEEKIPFPTLIKIDVEGWEIPVIEGMKQLFSQENSPVLIVEFTEDNAKLSGFSCADLFDLITSFNYSLYKYNWVTNTLSLQEKKEYYTYTNLVAIKKGSNYYNRLNNIKKA